MQTFLQTFYKKECIKKTLQKKEDTMKNINIAMGLCCGSLRMRGNGSAGVKPAASRHGAFVTRTKRVRGRPDGYTAN
ncbi:hypothetical protein [Dickeya poaceiphila]|uniref:hypothetical protein n=1 Tax=Dickeya poaceiphila TaxID=568768 RepID=UPI0011B15BF7|nr:hypothetical protein [Dickeya poaceiphila]